MSYREWIFVHASAQNSPEHSTTHLLFTGLKEFQFYSKSSQDTTFMLHPSSIRTFKGILLKCGTKIKRSSDGTGSSIRILLSWVCTILLESAAVQNPVKALFFPDPNWMNSLLFSGPFSSVILTKRKQHCHNSHCSSWRSHFYVFKPYSLLYAYKTSIFRHVFSLLGICLTSTWFLPNRLYKIVWYGLQVCNAISFGSDHNAGP